MSKWIPYYIKQAKEIATMSKDPSSKVGCIIVDKHNHPVGQGFNGMVAECDEGFMSWDRPYKYAVVRHAEENALSFSKADSLEGATAYVTHGPCERCLGALLQAKIRTVYYDCAGIMRDRGSDIQLWAIEALIRSTGAKVINANTNKHYLQELKEGKEMISARIIADSISALTGKRLTTGIIVLPRPVLAEFNTHRVFSRNSASSRAIPFQKMVDMVNQTPFVPLAFQKEHKGMQGTEYFTDPDEIFMLENKWLEARNSAVQQAKSLSAAGVTKQLCNRLLEPFMYHTIIVTSSEWENFFALRAHGAAEIHIAKAAEKMLEAYNASTPKVLNVGEWHIPFGDQFDTGRIIALDGGPQSSSFIESTKVKIATARCARVSYMNFEGKDDYSADIKLHDILREQGHMSPFEHCAQVSDENNGGNFGAGWNQYRKMFENENRRDPRVVSKT